MRRSELREKIVAGAQQPEAAFVNAAMVPSAFVLHLAAHKALAAAAAGKPTTRTLHSDLVFNLSPTNNVCGPPAHALRVRVCTRRSPGLTRTGVGVHAPLRPRQITESLKRFGVSAEARVLLVARFDGSEAEVRPREGLARAPER